MSDKPQGAIREPGAIPQSDVRASILARYSEPKKPRPAWFIPQTLHDALGERIPDEQVYENLKRRKPKTTRQHLGTRYTIYEDDPARDFEAGLRLNLYGERLDDLVREYRDFDVPRSVHEHVANIFSRTESERYMRTILRAESEFTQARIEPLTQLPNRRAFHERLAMQQREKVPGIVVMIDLDRFKAVNDTYGHDNGDLVLAQGAERARSVVRQAIMGMKGGTVEPSDIRYSDMVARLGGEEFAAIISDIRPGGPTPEGAAEIGERFVNAFNSRVFYILVDGKRTPIQVTGSVGAAVLRTDEDPADTLRRADEYVYFAKNSGRNRYAGEGITELPPKNST